MYISTYILIEDFIHMVHLMIRPCTEHHSLLWFISCPCEPNDSRSPHQSEECNEQGDI